MNLRTAKWMQCDKT